MSGGLVVAGVGASLGGFQALQALLPLLPEGLPAALVVVQHRRPEPESPLCDLLNAECPLLVSEPNDMSPIRGGQVYIAPADYHLLIEPGRFLLSVDPPVRFARPSADVLFETLAESYAQRAIAVVLTGSSDDGARGAEAVQRAGGRVLVQDPCSALASTAPRAVIDRIRPDAVEPLPDLVTRLLEWCDELAHE